MELDIQLEKYLEDYIKKNRDTLIKLHIGCGSKYWHSWCNIDANPFEDSDTHRGKISIQPDLWADIKIIFKNIFYISNKCLSIFSNTDGFCCKYFIIFNI